MMKTSVFLSLLLLLSSCYSYKEVSNNSITPNVIYKVKRTQKTYKIKVDSFTSNRLYYTKNKKINFVKLKDSLSIKKRTFSKGKTIGLVLGFATGIYLSYEFGKNETEKAKNNIPFPSIP